MKIVCVLLFGLCFATAIHSQCPDRLQLRERILYLKSSTVDYRQQLNELLPVAVLLEKCAQKNDSVRVLLLQRIGALHYYTGDFRQAVSSTLDAINVLHDARNTYKDTAFLLRVYNFLQIYYDSLKLVDNKMSAIDSCIHYALLTNEVNDAVLFNFWQLSSYAFDRGDFERCVEYSSMGEMLSRKHASPADSIAYASSFFTNRNNALIEMGEYDVAEHELHEKINHYKLAKLERLCGPFFNSLSVVSIRTGKYDNALRYLLNALEINRRYRQMLFTKECLNNIGFLYINNFNDPVTAIKYFKDALRYRSQNPLDAIKDDNETFHITANIGYAYAQINRFDSSDRYFERAFHGLEKGGDEQLIYVTGAMRLKAVSLLRRYRLTNDTAFLNQSLAVYKAGDRILTKAKANQMELQSQLLWRRDARQLYEQAIDACYAGNRPQTAFDFFERSRAVLLYDEISRNRAMSSADMQTRSQIEAKIEQLRSRLKAVPANTSEYADIQKNILFLNKQNDRLVSVKNSADTSILTYAAFKNNYDLGGKTLLEIFNGDSAVYIFTVTKTTITLKKLDKQKFATLSASFTDYVNDPSKCNSDFKGFVQCANQLYHLVFDNVNVDGSLVISPDNNNFPFEALVTTFSNNVPEYLIKSRAVTYTYSAGFLLLDVNAVQNAASPVILGMAPVQYPAKFGLASLHGSDESIKKIISRFRGSHAVTKGSASRSEFLNNFYKFRIVQLYTHGAETGTSGVPVIYFADSALNLFDLIPVNKPATLLVVLSACETAKGKYYKGEGVFSFNRAFAQAGIPSSIVNLWSVDDQSSYRLTELFYKYLAENMSFDEALQRAKVEFISTSGKERSLPFYWAATVLAGKSLSLQVDRRVPWMATAGIILLAIALIIGSFRLIKRRETYNSSSIGQYW